MTDLLQKAFDEASRLPDTEQDALAQLLLEELAAERQWDKLFGDSQDILSNLAQEALAEHRAGRTRELDPDKL